MQAFCVEGSSQHFRPNSGLVVIQSRKNQTTDFRYFYCLRDLHMELEL